MARVRKNKIIYTILNFGNSNKRKRIMLKRKKKMKKKNGLRLLIKNINNVFKMSNLAI